MLQGQRQHIQSEEADKWGCAPVMLPKVLQSSSIHIIDTREMCCTTCPACHINIGDSTDNVYGYKLGGTQAPPCPPVSLPLCYTFLFFMWFKNSWECTSSTVPYFNNVQCIIGILTSYAQVNYISLPGHIPGYKQFGPHWCFGLIKQKFH